MRSGFPKKLENSFLGWPEKRAKKPGNFLFSKYINLPELVQSAIDEGLFGKHHNAMSLPADFLDPMLPKVVGSFGSTKALVETTPAMVMEKSDLLEIRLDILKNENSTAEPAIWSHLVGHPLLFTARRVEEGGAAPFTVKERIELLKLCLADAALVDIEVASIPEMGALITELQQLGIPWVASFHDFKKLPAREILDQAARAAREAGATVFKVAAKLSGPQDMASLADFQLADHGLLVSSMGMGPLAPVSRLMLAQCGSVLNYGYLGTTPTAPGQWDSALLKQAISRLAPFSPIP